ncbi:nucleotidyltransferase family protein [Rhizobium johnstonii]|uniref:nucleotidyltransferase family protein n=1 Tax=Rhizobium TaxID=379 RepID=UPI0010315F8D|nr:nucleotidyltransferase family protein [Rhizobium leguminosarum]TBF67923.1 nucleotidyltransferase family protein [Rhizobium leguminosarum]TBG95607.1 nucleotidyltransferase family protein [Rhizobium leguminosarum]TBH27716.1 nucleotidyltransferase family protein [Rhizobium leguminosarum]TBH47772.1 nucleotidyltransferase family protein [Rhizobium leguminosarum]TBH63228.1 nucleotidyltransferase family protein [Rhizobium leguminosarum]
MSSNTTEFEAVVLASPLVSAVWAEWERLALPECWLVAGCLAQTVWNKHFAFPPEHAISDVDLVYFDLGDVSAEREQHHGERIRAMFTHLPVWIDVKNEARVHLWYEKKFGYPIAPYSSVKDAIGTFPTTATAVGIRPSGSAVEIYAPYGLDDLLNGTIKANKTQITREIFDAKAAKWLHLWPHLKVIPWDEC